MRRAIRSASIILFALALVSCGSFGGFGDLMQSAASGNTSASSSTEGLQKTGDAFQAASKEITPEEEYYIGRTVAATVLTIYKPWDNPRANEYLNTLGEGLSLASVLPETFTGYHFLIMDTDDINAFGAPSGFVLVSRGLLRCATSEDEVAAILAHEIGHVSLKHGLKAVSQGRWTDAFLQLAKFGAQNSDSAVLRSLTDSFGGVIGDIVKTMVTSGYSQDLEKQADLEAVRILHDVGYDPQALVRVLRVMKTRLKPDGKDFAKTHPDPDVRIAYLNDAIKQQTPPASGAAAQQLNARRVRYQSVMKGI